jgi:hypothetical protein
LVSSRDSGGFVYEGEMPPLALGKRQRETINMQLVLAIKPKDVFESSMRDPAVSRKRA